MHVCYGVCMLMRIHMHMLDFCLTGQIFYPDCNHTGPQNLWAYLVAFFCPVNSVKMLKTGHAHVCKKANLCKACTNDTCTMAERRRCKGSNTLPIRCAGPVQSGAVSKWVSL